MRERARDSSRKIPTISTHKAPVSEKANINKGSYRANKQNNGIVQIKARRGERREDEGKLKMWNEFIANKITLKCINKNGKIICFTFVFFLPSFLESRVSASTFCYFSLLPASLCVIVKVNILRYQGEISSRLTHPKNRQKKSFSATLLEGKPVIGPTNQAPSPFFWNSIEFFGAREKQKKVNSRILHTI